MFRKNPDAFALAAISLVMLAVTAARAPIGPPQPRWVVTPIKVEMEAHRDCIRAEMQAQRNALREAVQESVIEARRAIAQTFHRRY